MATTTEMFEAREYHLVRK